MKINEITPGALKMDSRPTKIMMMNIVSSSRFENMAFAIPFVDSYNSGILLTGYMQTE